MSGLMKMRQLNLARLYCTAKNVKKPVQSAAAAVPNVKGLSEKIVAKNSAKAVPGTGKEYNVPEYYSYNRMSYHEAECEMASFRCPQPSALK